MPLMRAMARTAVVAGTATAVSGRVQRRQSAKWSEQDQQQQMAYDQQMAAQQPVMAPPVDEGPDKATRLRELGELRDQGILTEEEFASEKAKVLAT